MCPLFANIKPREFRTFKVYGSASRNYWGDVSKQGEQGDLRISGGLGTKGFLPAAFLPRPLWIPSMVESPGLILLMNIQNLKVARHFLGL